MKIPRLFAVALFLLLAGTLLPQDAPCFQTLKQQKVPPYCCYCGMGQDLESCHVNNCDFCWGTSCGAQQEGDSIINELIQIPADSANEHLDGVFMEAINRITEDYNHPLTVKLAELNGSGQMRREGADFWTFSFNISSDDLTQTWHIVVENYGALDLRLVNQNSAITATYECRLQSGAHKDGTFKFDYINYSKNRFDNIRVIMKK